MKIKIDEKNELKIAAVIIAAEGTRTTARQLTCEEIFEGVKDVEKRLKILMPKKSWQGVKFMIDPHAQNFPHAYKGLPMSTAYRIERGSSAWFLTAVVRQICASVTQCVTPEFTDEHKRSMVEFLSTAKAWS